MITYKRKYEDKLRNDNTVRILSEEELEQVQRVYLQTALKITSVCAANGILITLSGGSVLGAVRHQGFIPWDDDMDMNITRKDFERFKEKFDILFRGEYRLLSPNYYRHSGYRIAKIENPGVRICDADGKTHGLLVDLFIIENMPDAGFIRLIRGIRCEMIRIIAGVVFEYERICSRESGCGKKRTLREALICTAGRIFSFRKSENWFDLVDRVNRWNDEKSKYVGVPSGRKHYFGEIYPREWLTRAVFTAFGGERLPVPEGYDPYLRKLYGDYMKIPREEDREHHYIRSISFGQGE